MHAIIFTRFFFSEIKKSEFLEVINTYGNSPTRLEVQATQVSPFRKWKNQLVHIALDGYT